MIDENSASDAEKNRQNETSQIKALQTNTRNLLGLDNQREPEKR